MNKQFVLIGTIVLLVCGGLSGCIILKPVVEGTGTIVYNDVEGGFYGIVADVLTPRIPLRKLDPIDLPQEFQQDGLRVWFKVRLRPDLYSYHMWGILVEILDIHKL